MPKKKRQNTIPLSSSTTELHQSRIPLVLRRVPPVPPKLAGPGGPAEGGGGRIGNGGEGWGYNGAPVNGLINRWVPGVITPRNSLINGKHWGYFTFAYRGLKTPFLTGRGPPCRKLFDSRYLKRRETDDVQSFHLGKSKNNLEQLKNVAHRSFGKHMSNKHL